MPKVHPVTRELFCCPNCGGEHFTISIVSSIELFECSAYWTKKESCRWRGVYQEAFSFCEKFVTLKWTGTRWMGDIKLFSKGRCIRHEQRLFTKGDGEWYNKQADYMKLVDYAKFVWPDIEITILTGDDVARMNEVFADVNIEKLNDIIDNLPDLEVA